MKIKEIEMIKFASDDELDNLIKPRFDNVKSILKKIGVINQFSVFEGKFNSDSRLRFYITDDNRPIAQLVLNRVTNDSKHWQVVSAFVIKDYRNRNIMLKLYEILLNRGLIIISDYSQTEASKRLYQKFLGKYKLSVVDTTNMEFLRPINTPEDLESVYKIPHEVIMVQK